MNKFGESKMKDNEWAWDSDDSFDDSETTVDEPLHKTKTENGADAYETTNNAAIDFFIRSIRNANADELIPYLTNLPILTIGKLLMQLRDPRNGKGEKALTYELLLWFRKTHPKIYVKNLQTFVDYGCYKDLLRLCSMAENKGLEMLDNELDNNNDYDNDNDNHNCKHNDYVELVFYADCLQKFFEDPKCGVSNLILKWVPTEKKSLNKKFNYTYRLAKLLFGDVKDGPAKLRKKLSEARKSINLTETFMCSDKWNEITYKHVPSRAHLRYTKSFQKHDKTRYDEYLSNVRAGKEKINVACIYPHELCNRALINYDETIQLQWDTMLDGLKKSANLGKSLAIIDVSGSMHGLPIDVAVSLGLIISELAPEPFTGKFITFSNDPELHKITGNTLHDKLNSIKKSKWEMNTDLYKVFKLLLDNAQLFNIRQDMFPETLFIFTDMQFDSAVPNTFLFDSIKNLYVVAGYLMPKIVFWNLRESRAAFPVTNSETGVVYLAGFSPILLKMVQDKNFDPETMLNSILAPYNFII